jgi:hypothetical protein
MVTFDNLTIINESQDFNITGSFINHEQTSTLTFIGDIRKNYSKAIVSVESHVPQSKNDKIFERQMLSVNLDIEKIQNGKNTHFATKLVLDVLFKSFKPPLKFPFTPNIYTVNLTIPNFPSFFSEKFRLEIKIFMVIAGKKKSKFASKILLRGTVGKCIQLLLDKC